MEISEKEIYEIIEGKVVLKPVLGNDAREIGEVMDNEGQTVEYFKDKFNVFDTKVDDLIDQIKATENKGSFLMKVIHLKEQIKELNGIGDFVAVNEKLLQIEIELQKTIDENRHKNLGYKQALLSELEVLAVSLDFTPETFNQVKEIQQKWIRVGRITEDQEEVYEARYEKSVKAFFDKRKEFLEAKKLLSEARAEKYREIIQAAKTLLEKKQFENKGEAFKLLQADWKKVGHIPSKLLNELWAEFKTVGDQYFTGLKKESKKQFSNDNRSQAGLKRKKELLEKSKTLFDLELSSAMTLAKELQVDWKNSGFVKKEDQKNMYEDFMLACDYVFEYRFLNSLFVKKNKAADTMEEAERVSLKVKLIKNLIRKDNDDISSFEDNSLGANMVIRGNSSFGKVVDSRVSSQKRKLEAKNIILKQLQLGKDKV